MALVRGREDKRRRVQEWQDIRAFMQSEAFREACKQDLWFRHWHVWVAVAYPVVVGIFVCGIILLIAVYVPEEYQLPAFTAVAVQAALVAVWRKFRCGPALELFAMRLMLSPYKEAFERFLRERKAHP